jgi:hypothetical protein
MASKQGKSPAVAGLVGGAEPGGMSLLGSGDRSPLTGGMRIGTQGEMGPLQHSTTIPPEQELRPWRGIMPLNYRRRVLLEVPVDIRTADLPRWKPRSIGDSGRASQDDE